MPAVDLNTLSDSRVNKAGKTLRYFFRGKETDMDRVSSALDVLSSFRSAHQAPMTSANMGLRSMIRTARCEDAEVSQRLKRTPTILNKLLREPSLPLSKMQDLGGCRAVLGSIDEVYAVLGRLELRDVERVTDYIQAPRDSGYRGIHVIVKYRGRRVEVQLRTQIMHQWAVTVERLTSRMDVDVKSGAGPEPVQALMRVISQAMAIEEKGGTVGKAVLEDFAQAQRAAAPYLQGG